MKEYVLGTGAELDLNTSVRRISPSRQVDLTFRILPDTYAGLIQDPLG
jgi:hypothetical protein